eukprot:6175346-Pleurochrysis_carterae.AAC.3
MMLPDDLYPFQDYVGRRLCENSLTWFKNIMSSPNFIDVNEFMKLAYFRYSTFADRLLIRSIPCAAAALRLSNDADQRWRPARPRSDVSLPAATGCEQATS